MITRPTESVLWDEIFLAELEEALRYCRLGIDSLRVHVYPLATLDHPGLDYTWSAELHAGPELLHLHGNARQVGFPNHGQLLRCVQKQLRLIRAPWWARLRMWYYVRFIRHG